MKKGLVPTGFSDNAWNALTYIIRLYDDISCRFYILNTTSRTINTMHKEKDTHIYRIIKEASEKELKKIETYLLPVVHFEFLGLFQYIHSQSKCN